MASTEGKEEKTTRARRRKGKEKLQGQRGGKERKDCKDNEERKRKTARTKRNGEERLQGQRGMERKDCKDNEERKGKTARTTRNGKKILKTARTKRKGKERKGRASGQCTWTIKHNDNPSFRYLLTPDDRVIHR